MPKRRLRATQPPPVPRPAPVRVGFGIPAPALRRSALHFWKLLEEAEAFRNAPAADQPVDNPDWRLEDAAAHLESYAWAVQVFAAVTVEAALNTYGLVRFNAEQFELHFRFAGPVPRLKAMLAFGAGVNLDDDDALVTTLKSLMAKRDRIVHMQSDEEQLDSGAADQPSAAPDPVAEAKAALQDMDVFFRRWGELLVQGDPEAWVFVMPW